MSKIDLRQFVDINIIAREVSSIDNIRDTMVLYTEEEKATETALPEYFSSMSNVSTYFASTTNTYKYLKVFFDNGGLKVKVIDNTSISNLTTTSLKELDNKYICIAYAPVIEGTTTVASTYTALKALAASMASDSSVYGINEKIILSRAEEDNSDTTKNFVVKYSTQIGAEMSIAAYLTKINVYKINSVFDYAFTEEVVTSQDITDETFKSLMSHNFNVDLNLANAIRNCGGNCKNGQDLVNTYVKIILHQTLTDQLVNLLSQKIKGTTGISKIYSTMSQELEQYLNCGYLTTDKIWTDDDYVITRNGVDYVIIEKGTPLVKGYMIKILPMSSLTNQEKTEHSAPPIYVIIADQYGIRKITINGEVI